MNFLQYTICEKYVDYNKCYEICHSALNNHVPRKMKYIRRNNKNNKSFMTKPYSRAIMQRTRFTNKFIKNATNENKLINKETSVSLLRKEKKEYFAKINENDIIDDTKFWDKLLRTKSKEPITLVNNENIFKLKSQKPFTF